MSLWLHAGGRLDPISVDNCHHPAPQQQHFHIDAPTWIHPVLQQIQVNHWGKKTQVLLITTVDGSEPVNSPVEVGS